MNVCLHCRVYGRVQGVFFRGSTQTEAKVFGLSGWAKNMPDGTVDVMACGSQENVAKLHQWLMHGPSMANVKRLECEELAYQHYDSFDIG